MSAPAVDPSLADKIPILRGLNPTELRQLAEIVHERAFAPGELILRQGERSQQLWVVIEGACEVVRQRDGVVGDPLVLAELGPYAHFGEMSFFHPAPHSASVRASTPMKLLYIIRSEYDDLVEQGVWAGYKLAYNVLQALAERLRLMDQRVAELATEHAEVEQRIAHAAVPPASNKSGPTATATKPAASQPEWSRFREKLFNGWNL